jgi:hypothetical protein
MLHQRQAKAVTEVGKHYATLLNLFPTGERLKTERDRLPAVSVHNAEVLSKLRGHYNGSRSVEESGIIVERCNHPPDELGAFAIRQIQPTAPCGFQNTLSSDQASVKRNNADATVVVVAGVGRRD